VWAVITEPSIVASRPAVMLVQPSSGSSQGSVWGRRWVDSESRPTETASKKNTNSHLDFDFCEKIDMGLSSNNKKSGTQLSKLRREMSTRLRLIASLLSLRARHHNIPTPRHLRKM
jgi:hypothetical protein